MVSALQVAREHKNEESLAFGVCGAGYRGDASRECRLDHGAFQWIVFAGRFQEPELRPCLGELLQLPGDGVYELFGDASHEELIQVMAFWGIRWINWTNHLSNELVD
ncbi:MAG: hypothetical protein R3C12_01055 [Planctomycetaceae bacterium]